MEIAENEENNTTSPVNNPPSPSSTHYRRAVNIVYTICICVHISAGTGFKKEVYLQPLKCLRRLKLPALVGLFVCIFCLFQENFIILILIFKYLGILFFWCSLVPSQFKDFFLLGRSKFNYYTDRQRFWSILNVSKGGRFW